jgi:murein DD-endopeptidase MepM/ murein hydrolase activator NlpD
VRAVAAGVVASAVFLVGLPTAHAAGSDLDQARARANSAAAALAKAETQLSLVQTDLAAVEAKRKDNAAKVQSLQASVRDVAVTEFIRGRGTKALFDVDPADASAGVRARALQSIVASGATDTVDAYRAAIEDLDAQEARLVSLRKSADAALASVRKQQAAVDAELKRLVALDKQQRAAAAQRSTARVIGSGNWVCPVQGPHAFSDDFGQPRSGGRRHQGNDIMSPRGTPVVTPVAGSAERHYDALGGQSFYVHGADGNTYYGAHLDSYTNNFGSVVAGTVLGYVGNTGDAAGGPTHLHFEIHPGGGAAVDPYPTLRQYC